eukprot:868183-Amphidinium_carterae.1
MAIGVTWFLVLCRIVGAGAETVEHVIPLDNPDYITLFKEDCSQRLPYLEDNKLVLNTDTTNCGKTITVHLPPEVVCDRSQSIVISYVLELFPGNAYFHPGTGWLRDTDSQNMLTFVARDNAYGGQQTCEAVSSFMHGGVGSASRPCDFLFGPAILRQPFRVDMLLNATAKGLAVDGYAMQFTHDSEGEACPASLIFGSTTWGLGWWTGHTLKLSDVRITVSGSKPSTTSQSASTTSTSITTSS